VYFPKEIKELYLRGTIIIVLKLLYSVVEAGTHWRATYFKHYREKLYIITLTYDLCLFITTTKERFAIVKI
jgi:hypothetical protein